MPRYPIALALGLSLLPGLAAAQECDGARDLRGSDLTGTWAVFQGAAQTGGSAMFGGSDTVTIQSTGGGLTLGIEGFRIALQRLSDDTLPWAWTKIGELAVDSDEFEVTAGCANDDPARFEGTQSVAGQTVTWRVMAQDAKTAFVLWSFAGPPPSAGLFPIST